MSAWLKHSECMEETEEYPMSVLWESWVFMNENGAVSV